MPLKQVLLERLKWLNSLLVVTDFDQLSWRLLFTSLFCAIFEEAIFQGAILLQPSFIQGSTLHLRTQCSNSHNQPGHFLYLRISLHIFIENMKTNNFVIWTVFCAEPVPTLYQHLLIEMVMEMKGMMVVWWNTDRRQKRGMLPVFFSCVSGCHP